LDTLAAKALKEMDGPMGVGYLDPKEITGKATTQGSTPLGECFVVQSGLWWSSNPLFRY